MSGDRIYCDIFVKFLQSERFIMRVFFSFHDRSCEDFLSASSFFQKLNPDVTLHKFLFIIQKSEESSVHQRRFPCAGRTSDDAETSKPDFGIDVIKIVFVRSSDLHIIVARRVLKSYFHFLLPCDILRGERSRFQKIFIGTIK